MSQGHRSPPQRTAARSAAPAANQARRAEHRTEGEFGQTPPSEFGQTTIDALPLSVIVPVLNEAAGAEGLLQRLQQLPVREIIVVDGGSRDGSVELLTAPCPERFPALCGGRYRLLRAPCGRARQMNAGAQVATSDVLLFLHADTSFSSLHAVAAARAVRDGADFGCFSLRLRSPRKLLRLIGDLITLRSQVLPSATGDQAIFMRRALFAQLGGYREIALCEDLDLVSRARRAGRFTCLPFAVETSARRWEQRGVLRTVALMWGLRLACLAGADPALLKQIYEDVR